MLNNVIKLAHGSGGILSHDLVENIFLRHFTNPLLQKLEDSAVLNGYGTKLALTTDSYVVDPIFFPGGDIGKLAVCGTVNDLAVQGATPRYLTAGFIIEEGFDMKQLELIVKSMQKTALSAGVEIVAGDTKVVNKGAADKIFINTAGIGFLENKMTISSHNVQAGDAVIINGGIAEHGLAIMLARENLGLSIELDSDVAPLNVPIQELIKSGVDIHAMRDPTRGGLASTLNEIAMSSQITIEIDEKNIPVKENVRAGCEILGLDPLTLANEGKMILFAPPRDAEKIVSILRSYSIGRKAAIIGQVTSGKSRVFMTTLTDATRLIDMPVGESLPRIC